NGIHFPVGRPVTLELTSRDVIHSFWVPSLQGKRDLIPGHVNTTWLQADVPALFHGQCAEFCGVQHAHMAFLIVAEPESSFSAWIAAQTRPPSRASPCPCRRFAASARAGRGACFTVPSCSPIATPHAAVYVGMARWGPLRRAPECASIALARSADAEQFTMDFQWTRSNRCNLYNQTRGTRRAAESPDALPRREPFGRRCVRASNRELTGLRCPLRPVSESIVCARPNDRVADRARRDGVLAGHPTTTRSCRITSSTEPLALA